MPFELKVRDKDKSLTLTEYPCAINDNPYWLVREDGEGQSISEKNLFDLLDKWFEENM